MEECQRIIKHSNVKQMRSAFHLNLKQFQANKTIASIQDYFLCSIKEKSIEMLYNILKNTTTMIQHILPELGIRNLHWILSTVNQSAFQITPDIILVIIFLR